MEQEKVFLNVEETAAYLNLGMTKIRELMREKNICLQIDKCTIFCHNNVQRKEELQCR